MFGRGCGGDGAAARARRHRNERLRARIPSRSLARYGSPEHTVTYPTRSTIPLGMVGSRGRRRHARPATGGGHDRGRPDHPRWPPRTRCSTIAVTTSATRSVSSARRCRPSPTAATTSSPPSATPRPSPPQRRQRLVEATRAVDTVTATAGRVVEASGGDLRAGLESLDPVLQGLAESGARSPSRCATWPPSRSRGTPTATRCAGTTPTARSSSTFGCRSWTPRCSSAHRSRGRWRRSTPSWAYPPHPVDQSDVAHRAAFPMAFRDDRGGAHGRRAVGADDLLLQD